jgi:hypothetical protein
MTTFTPQDERLRAAERATAARLRQWSGRPLWRSNLLAVACALVSVAWLYAASAGAPDRALLLRQAAVLFIAFHGVAYVLWLRMLRRLGARGMPEARDAMAAYMDPRRLTNLDLGMFWVTIFALAPHLV